MRDGVGGWVAYLGLVSAAPLPPRHRLDVSDGLPVNLPPLSADVATTLEVYAHDRFLGSVSVDPPLDRPIRPYLADLLLEDLLLPLASAFDDERGRSEPGARPGAAYTRQSLPPSVPTDSDATC